MHGFGPSRINNNKMVVGNDGANIVEAAHTTRVSAGLRSEAREKIRHGVARKKTTRAMMNMNTPSKCICERQKK